MAAKTLDGVGDETGDGNGVGNYCCVSGVGGGFREGDPGRGGAGCGVRDAAEGAEALRGGEVRDPGGERQGVVRVRGDHLQDVERLGEGDGLLGEGGVHGRDGGGVVGVDVLGEVVRHERKEAVDLVARVGGVDGAADLNGAEDVERGVGAGLGLLLVVADLGDDADGGVDAEVDGAVDRGELALHVDVEDLVGAAEEGEHAVDVDEAELLVAAEHGRVGSSQGAFLDDPRAAPVGPCGQVMEGSPAAVAEFAGALLENSVQFDDLVGLVGVWCQPPDEIVRLVACVGGSAEPDDGRPGGLVDVAHALDFGSALPEIALVDAERVDPDLPPGLAKGARAEGLEGSEEIRSHVDGLAVQLDGAPDGRVAPCVAESHKVAPDIAKRWQIGSCRRRVFVQIFRCPLRPVAAVPIMRGSTLDGGSVCLCVAFLSYVMVAQGADNWAAGIIRRMDGDEPDVAGVEWPVQHRDQLIPFKQL